METMGKLIQMKVLISGLRGLGVEVAKNLILAGPAMVILHDDSIAEQRDLGANFYLTEQDVGSRTRAEASLKQLSELNPYVSVRTHQGPLTEELLSGVSLVVFSETSQSELLRWNEVCRTRNPPVGFIAADCFGLASSVFVDFGESFTCRDKDGEEPRSAIVSGVTLESPGTVHTHQDRRHGFNDGDWVVFREVQGMTQLNDGKPRQIKDMGSFLELSGRRPYSFSIEDTTGYSAYVSDGIVTQTKVPHSIKFSSYKQSLVQPKHSGEEMHAETSECISQLKAADLSASTPPCSHAIKAVSSAFAIRMTKAAPADSLSMLATEAAWKIKKRLLPIFVLVTVANYLDRGNISYAAEGLKQRLPAVEGRAVVSSDAAAIVC
eukprot:s4738_g1.t2